LPGNALWPATGWHWSQQAIAVNEKQWPGNKNKQIGGQARLRFSSLLSDSTDLKLDLA